MKSIADIRIFSVEQATKIMGAGTADKDIVSKAKEVEAYIINGLTIPENSEETILSDIINLIGLFVPEKKDEILEDKITKKKDK